MCELLGMSSRYPTDLQDSLALFRPRGGEIGPHADGWGMAVYEDHAVQLFKEPKPASDSEFLEFLNHYDLEGQIVLAHIRRANPRKFSRVLANTHPFRRELGGRDWVYAHNGKLPGIRERDLRWCTPLGDTDSEYAFCWLMEQLQKELDLRQNDPDLDDLLAVLVDRVSELNVLGEFNFLLGNGKWLIAHAHTQLHTLRRACRENGCDQLVQLVASNPLTEESWTAVPPNRLVVFRDGSVVSERDTEGELSEEEQQKLKDPDSMEARSSSREGENHKDHAT